MWVTKKNREGRMEGFTRKGKGKGITDGRGRKNGRNGDSTTEGKEVKDGKEDW